MSHCNFVLDAITYNTCMNAYMRLKQWDKCFDLKDRMESIDVDPSSITYGILLGACIEGGKTDLSKEYYAEMQIRECAMNPVLKLLLYFSVYFKYRVHFLENFFQAPSAS